MCGMCITKEFGQAVAVLDKDIPRVVNRNKMPVNALLQETIS